MVKRNRSHQSGEKNLRRRDKTIHLYSCSMPWLQFYKTRFTRDKYLWSGDSNFVVQPMIFQVPLIPNSFWGPCRWSNPKYGQVCFLKFFEYKMYYSSWKLMYCSPTLNPFKMITFYFSNILTLFKNIFISPQPLLMHKIITNLTSFCLNYYIKLLLCFHPERFYLFSFKIFQST